MGYTIEKGREITGVPQLKIEKISQDNSLFLKVESSFSTITDEFIKLNELREIVVVNNLEKKILICSVSADYTSVIIDDITKTIGKHQKNLE